MQTADNLIVQDCSNIYPRDGFILPKTTAAWIHMQIYLHHLLPSGQGAAPMLTTGALARPHAPKVIELETALSSSRQRWLLDGDEPTNTSKDSRRTNSPCYALTERLTGMSMCTSFSFSTVQPIRALTHVADGAPSARIPIPQPREPPSPGRLIQTLKPAGTVTQARITTEQARTDQSRSSARQPRHRARRRQ